MEKPIQISPRIIFSTLLIILGLAFIYAVRDIIALLFIAVIVFSLLDPLVDWLEKKRINRSVGVILIYIIFFALIGTAFSFLIPPVIEQAKEFSQNLPQYSQNLQNSFAGINNFFQTQHVAFDIQKIINESISGLTSFSGNIFSTTVGFFSGFISVLVVLALAFYMTATKDGIKKFVVLLTPEAYKNYAADSVMRVQRKIGKWMQGQLILMLIIAVLDFVGLSIIGVPFALILAIFAGIMEIIPYFGPLISAIPGIILGFTISPWVGFLAGVVYFVAQQFESHVIVPQVMKKAVGLNPIAVILALLVGIKLGGVMGAILSIPIATAAGVFLGDFFNKEKI